MSSTATYEPYSADFEPATSTAFRRSGSSTSAFGGTMSMFNSVRPAAIMAPADTATPLVTSPPPQPPKKYMTMAEQEMEAPTRLPKRLPKRLRQNALSRSLTSGMASRRDGVRKKNARFEIPEGRNVNNIDHLISQASTEEEIKDLKQQKRLLRNRQAAYEFPSPT
jgi:hypothetical protein